MNESTKYLKEKFIREWSKSELFNKQLEELLSYAYNPKEAKEICIIRDINTHKPSIGWNGLVSNDNGKTFSFTADYTDNSTYMLSGIAVGNGYFGEGFACDGTKNTEEGLILTDITHWIEKKLMPELTDDDIDNQSYYEYACTKCGGFGYYESGGETWDCDCQKTNDRDTDKMEAYENGMKAYRNWLRTL